MYEIAIRKNGKVTWVKLHDSVISTLINGDKAVTFPKSSPKEFDLWYNLYNKKVTRKQSVNYWKKHIDKKLVPKIMSHTRRYIKDRERVYRLDPIRYLKRATWDDEIIKVNKEYENYKMDTRGAARFGYCSKCGELYFGGITTIHLEETKCCQGTVLPKRG
tara:strand:- start:842 stop:1324 length:483 start_codon:yes stop_codon:yes gene_type:complete